MCEIYGNSHGSYRYLWSIYEESKFEELIESSKLGSWGVKPEEGLIYPNIGTKIQGTIINFIRMYKLNRILI